MAATYNPVNDGRSPYASGSPDYTASTGHITPHPAPKRRTNNWIKFGVPVLVIVIIAAVVGGVVGSRKSHNNKTASSGSKADSSPDSPDASAAASSAASVKLAVGRFATATNSEFMVPIYPSTTNTAAYSVVPVVDYRRRVGCHSRVVAKSRQKSNTRLLKATIAE